MKLEAEIIKFGFYNKEEILFREQKIETKLEGKESLKKGTIKRKEPSNHTKYPVENRIHTL